MSDSNWGDRAKNWVALSLALNIIAILVALFLYFLPYPNFGSSSESSRSSYQEYATDCDNAETAYRSFVSRSAATNVHDTRRQYDTEKAERARKFVTTCDLAAQYLAAEGSESAAHSGWYTMGAALFGVLLLIGTLLETMRVTRVTKEIGEKQVRAYLSAEVKKAWVEKFPWVTEVVQVGGEIVIKNHGSSPARDIQCVVTYFFNEEPAAPISGSSKQVLHVGDTLAPDATDSALPVCVVEMNKGNVTLLQFTGSSLFKMNISTAYHDVFGEPHFDEFDYYLFNGKSAALNAHRSSTTPKSISVEWRRYNQSDQDGKNLNPPISSRDLFG